MNKSLVSICIPAYNVELTIKETLDSLVAQSYENVQIFVGDNCSQDRTAEIVQSFVERDARIKLIKHSENVGYVANINSLVAMTSSDLIAIYHADDIYNENIIQKQVDAFTIEQETAAVFPKMYVFYGSDSSSVESYEYPAYFKYLINKSGCYWGKLAQYLPAIVSVGNLFACPGLMVKRDVYYKVGGFTERYKTNEDLDLWIRILEKGYTIGIIDEYLMKYRISIVSASYSIEKQPTLNVFFSVLKDFLVRRTDLATPLIKRQLARQKAKQLLKTALKAYKLKCHDLVIKNVQESIKEIKYPLFSIWGIFQRAPLLILPLYNIYERIKAIKSSSTLTYREKGII